jgi:hypothetical protein
MQSGSLSDRAAKPKGKLGAEIWRHIGTKLPAGEADFQFITLDTATPYVVYYTMADAGKKVWYMLRSVSKNGDKGERSETIEVTVNG